MQEKEVLCKKGKHDLCHLSRSHLIMDDLPREEKSSESGNRDRKATRGKILKRSLKKSNKVTTVTTIFFKPPRNLM